MGDEQFPRMCPGVVRQKARPTVCVLQKEHEGRCEDFIDVLERRVRTLANENGNLKKQVEWSLDEICQNTAYEEKDRLAHLNRIAELTEANALLREVVTEQGWKLNPPAQY